MALLLLLFTPLVLSLPIAEELDVDFILGSACAFEAWQGSWTEGDLDEELAESCGECWTPSALEAADEEGLEEAKNCVYTFMPRIEAACEEEIENLSPGGGDEAVLRCFQTFVQEQDELEVVENIVTEYLEQERENASEGSSNYDKVSAIVMISVSQR